MNVLPFVRRQWIPLAAVAALLIAAGGLLVTREIAPHGPLQAPAAHPGPTAAPAVAVLLLTLGTSRAAGTPASVTVPKDASILQLRVRLDPSDRFDRYSIDLRASSDRSVWHGEDLRASAVGDGLALVASVPASSLESGSYELAVRGASGEASYAALGFVTVKISRTP
jgi:hypothetical protein